ncbi:hypothetical protein [Clostridium intestinale]|uniref:hypothetical protein n=1 Tax=Clostridium intestinale TaxID=36845 RepID=UPI0028E57C70|nr:hypothetical protein [Clostridium intestinale]
MNNKSDTFKYTYSAKQQEEVENIRQKYIPRKENKMEQLRKLDKDATMPGTITSIVIGVFGTLLIGIGLTCTLVWTQFFILGIIVGIIGIVAISAAYPIFENITKKQREKIAPQILKLTEELMDKK